MTKSCPDRMPNKVMKQQPDDNRFKVLMDQFDDNRSTSASGSDSELEAKRSFFDWSSGASDNEMTSDEELNPSMAKTLGRKFSPVRLPEWTNVFGRMASRLRCVGRARSRDMDADIRRPPGLEKGAVFCSDSEGDDGFPLDELASDTEDFQGDSEPIELGSPPAGLASRPPPGLSLPPGLELPDMLGSPPGLDEQMPDMTSPPGLPPTTKYDPDAWGPPPSVQTRPPWRKSKPQGAKATVPKVFNLKDFHKELVKIFRDLASDCNVGGAVKRVRMQGVPKEHQAAEFTDILTRASEERRGMARRLNFAFAAGLVAAEPSAFEKEEVLKGLRDYFEDVFPDLCDEVPRLRSILALELLPTLRNVLPAAELTSLLPLDMRVV